MLLACVCVLLYAEVTYQLPDVMPYASHCFVTAYTALYLQVRSLIIHRWQLTSVVGTLVTGRRTFPGLPPISGWRVTTLWVKLSAMGQQTRLTQPSIPPGLVNGCVFTSIMGMDTILQTGAVYGCNAAGSKSACGAWAAA